MDRFFVEEEFYTVIGKRNPGDRKIESYATENELRKALDYEFPDADQDELEGVFEDIDKTGKSVLEKRRTDDYSLISLTTITRREQ